MKIESKHNVAKYILAFGSVQGLIVAISVIRNKLVALLLGPNGVGVMSLYNSAATLVQNATSLGLDKSALNRLSQIAESGDERDVRKTLRLVRSLFAVSALLGVMVMVCFSWALSLIVASDLSYTLQFVALSPMLGFAIIAMGEMVVLKAFRRLKRVAMVSLLSAVSLLGLVTVLFYQYGMSAIIPALVGMTLMHAVIVMCYSCSIYRMEWSFRWSVLREGVPLLKLGLSFVMAGVLSSASDFLLRSFLYNVSSDVTVGLYNTAYMMAFTYAGIVFTSLDTEYFPRLCGMLADETADCGVLRTTIRRQIKVSLAIIVPLVAAMYVLLPWLIPLFLSDAFVAAVPMARVTLLAMVCRAVYLPIAYLPLAKGDSATYLTIEALSALLTLLCVTGGYSLFGLIGCGIGLVASNAMDIVLNVVACRWRYGDVV